MGQILVINNVTPFTPEDEQEYNITNNIYYHWSAYTARAILELTKLKNHIKQYYDKYYSNNVNPKDFFNLACLTAISDIETNNIKSIKYITKLEPRYNNESADRTYGLIAFNDDRINDYIDYADGTIDIDWVFDKNGKPDFNKTKFDLWSVLDPTQPENYKNWYNKTDAHIEKIKKIKCDINIFEISLSEIESLLDRLPNKWYDPEDDRIYTHIV